MHSEETVDRAAQFKEQTTQPREVKTEHDRFFALSLDMLAIANFEGCFLKINPAWTATLGWTETELVNKPYLDFVHPDDVEATIAEAQRLSEGHPTIKFENRYRHKDGSYRWLSWKVASFPQTQHLYAIAHDITEDKQIEVQREELLQQEKAAREAAENANRIKDEFLAVLSHELRTPLNPILGWSKLLQRSTTDPNLLRGLETIERNAKLQAQLIDDLLDVSRILRGKLVLHQSAVALSAVIRSALETVELAAQVKSINLTTNLDPTVGNVLGDPGRLQQIVWNLLSNAVKFTPDGGKVEVRLGKAGSTAFLQVNDTGKGIAPDFVPFVFESFRQEDNATTRNFGGLGLGLAIARQLVELHGGTIKVESLGEGKGATFTVMLPLMD
ncbi:multi-sensor hybrid histidine kinase [Leptolyngbya sp. NIES-3755]|nr:multi-sensor hybrid histidine kinase [Leptolyngbya sp. NIES-3755]